jgi:hypothetical protein
MANTRDLAALWFWPWHVAQAQLALVETAIATPAVIGARLPIIADAMRNPVAADTRELTRMVTEKTAALGQSSARLTATWRKIESTSRANALDLNKLSGGGFLWPADYLRMAERNLEAFAALATLPGEAIGPVHKRATANARRLRK